MIEIINELVVDDINKSIDFYNKYFDFELVETDKNPIVWCKIKKDSCYIMIEEYKEVCSEIPNFPKRGISNNLIKFKLSSRDAVENLYKKAKEEDAAIFMELKDTYYGSLEFGILDLDRNMLIISY